MRKLLIWILALLILFVMAMVAAYYLAKKYEEPVRNYIVSEVNKRLDAPVHVSDINFSLLERFPSASLVMDSVWAEEDIVKIGDPDTLLFFRKVYLNLNVLDILNGQYKINEIETRDGFLRLKVDEKGFDNYRIWKESEDTTGFLLELDKVHIENGLLSYENKARDQEIKLTADDLYFAGSFSRKDYTMEVKGDGIVHELRLKGNNYLDERKVAVQSELEINAESETYTFKDGRLLIDNALDFNISGNFIGSGVDLSIVGNDLDIIRSLSLLPLESRKIFEAYSSSGILDFQCTLKGAFGRTENPRLQAEFSIENGAISKKGSKWKLSDLSGSGSVDNGERRKMTSTRLSLDVLSGKFNGDPFESQFVVSNFQQPNIDGKAKLKTNIQAVDEFLDIEFIDEGKGELWIDASINTTLVNPSESSARDFLNSKASGSIHISNAELRLKDDDRYYGIDSAHFNIVDNSLDIVNYTGRINDCELSLKGKADHFLDYFFTENGILNVNGDIKTGVIDLRALFPTEGESEGNGSIVIAFSQRATWDLNIQAESFLNGKFEALDVQGRLLMDEYKVEARNLKFGSLGGSMEGNAGVYRFAKNQFGVKADFDATALDVKALFYTFNNFDQSFIRSEHITGTASAVIHFQAFCDSTLNIDSRSVVATSELKILDGSLENFEPLISVADEIKKKPMLRLFVSTDELKKRLENIQFAQLENQITIRDGVVQIPQMDIKSSAINLNVSGTHSFDHEINYAMDFALSELVELKDRKEPYNEYVNRDETGRTRVFLTMIGTTDDFEIDVKRTNVKSTIKEDLQSEKNVVKGLLREEFTRSPSDTSSEVNQAGLPKVEIDFDPEEGLEKDSTLEQQSTEKPKKKSGFGKIIKKTETNKKKLGDGEFDDDDF
ncbi:MAG: hypothetical protein KC456_11445 [Flavobacteriales bacterium]|nr:hypothetical protein [Flavobacteriales bacterium]